MKHDPRMLRLLVHVDDPTTEVLELQLGVSALQEAVKSVVEAHGGLYDGWEAQASPAENLSPHDVIVDPRVDLASGCVVAVGKRWKHDLSTLPFHPVIAFYFNATPMQCSAIEVDLRARRYRLEADRRTWWETPGGSA